MLLLICALAPLALGGALPFLRIENRKARMAYVMAVTCLTSLLVAAQIFWGPEERIELFYLADRFVCALRLAGPGKIYLGLAALLWPLAILYAIEYMGHEKREGRFFSWYTMAYGAVILFASADNLFTLYIFYELITLLTIPLVAHEQDGASIQAAKAYMIFLFGGAALGFAAMMGMTLLGAGEFASGGAEAIAFHGLTESQGITWLRVLAVAGFLGFGVKAAVLPLSRWLPTASVAPTPVTALLHAVAVVNAGVYAVSRFLYDAVPLSDIKGSWAQAVMLILSIATIVYGSVMAVREQHLKRRLAWSTVANLSYMLMGLSLLTESGRRAGLTHMAFHGLMKIILFFCAGAVLVQTGRTKVRALHGLGRKMPLTFGAFILAGTALMGVPPLPGFISKYALATAALETGGALGLCGAVAMLISSVLTVIYIFTVVYQAFFMGYQPAAGETEPKDPGACMKTTFIVLCLLLIAAGIWGGRAADVIAALAGGISL